MYCMSKALRALFSASVESPPPRAEISASFIRPHPALLRRRSEGASAATPRPAIRLDSCEAKYSACDASVPLLSFRTDFSRGSIDASVCFGHGDRGDIPACATASQVQDVATAIGALVLKLRKINVPPEFTATSSELPASMTTSAWGTTSCRCVHSSSAPTSRFIAPLSSVELRRLDGRRAAAEAIDAAGSLLATNPPSWTCTAWQVVSPVPEWFGFDTAGGISAPAPISASREAATPAEPSRAE
eukprot:7390249-Prymnesium_polylepis.1